MDNGQFLGILSGGGGGAGFEDTKNSGFLYLFIFHECIKGTTDSPSYPYCKRSRNAPTPPVGKI